MKASGRDIFVNNLSGNDRNRGGAEATLSPSVGPVRTIARAARIADFGDRIVLANTGEPYRECVTLHGHRNSGSEYSPFVIEGNGAVLDGSIAIPADAWEPVAGDVLAFRPPHISFTQLYLDGKPAKRREISLRSQLTTLQPHEWVRSGDRILYRVRAGALPQDDPLTVSIHPAGLTLYHVENVLVQNLVVQGFRLDGVNAHDSAFDCTLREVTSRGNGRSGVSVGGASRVLIEDCVLGDNQSVQLRTEGWSTTIIRRSELLDDVAPAWQMEGGQLTIDGQVHRRAEPSLGYDRAPLHRP